MLATLLALADSRLPAGGHAHSAGAEQAVADGIVTDIDTLALLLRRRLATAGTVTAGLAAAAASVVTASPAAPPSAIGGRWLETGPQNQPPSTNCEAGARAALDRLNAEADARMPLAATRAASRALGRGLVRVGRLAWPTSAWDLLPRAPHHSIALGVAAAAGSATPCEAAVTAAYLSLTGPATAAQRLLGLDPVAVATLLVSMTPDLHEVARTVVDAALPTESDVLSDLLTARHSPREDKLFAS